MLAHGLVVFVELLGPLLDMLVLCMQLGPSMELVPVLVLELLILLQQLQFDGPHQYHLLVGNHWNQQYISPIGILKGNTLDTIRHKKAQNKPVGNLHWHQCNYMIQLRRHWSLVPGVRCHQRWNIRTHTVHIELDWRVPRQSSQTKLATYNTVKKKQKSNLRI